MWKLEFSNEHSLFDFRMEKKRANNTLVYGLLVRIPT